MTLNKKEKGRLVVSNQVENGKMLARKRLRYQAIKIIDI